MDSMNGLLDALPVVNWKRPAVSLFPELLSHIFMLGVQSWGGVEFPHNITIPDMGRIRKARFTLAAVCKRWREVVVSTPAIWSAIMLSYSKKGFDSNLFMTEFDRSGNHLLSLYITDFSPSPHISRKGTSVIKTRTFNVAHKVLQRCKSINIDSNQLLVDHLLGPLSKIPLPNLRALSISTHPQRISSTTTVIDLSSAPGLRDLRLQFPQSKYPVRLKISSHAALRCLKVSTRTIPQEVIGAINQNLSLEVFSWTTVQTSLYRPFHSQIPPMLHLRQLALSGKIALSTLASFDAPNLTVLDILYQGKNESEAPPYPFPTLVEILFPNLQVLNIGGHSQTIRAHESTVISFIRAHSTLKIVSVSQDITEPLAEALCSLPSLLHVTASRNRLHHAQVLPLLRNWYTRTISIPGWSSPTLHLQNAYNLNMWSSDEINNPDLSKFLHQIWVESPVFKGQEGAAYWDDLLGVMTRERSSSSSESEPRIM
ncbi:hypothetical protein DL93DRAFT_1884070 [Clavulina sp. PMI_390]|nr:hypothetical protein DL93DRAFT_1884070 [Clavulina sp. PMI_390]